MAYLINGNGFSPVLAQDDADFYAGLVGAGGMLDIGGKMAATVVNATTIRLTDGVYVDGEGRRVQIRPGGHEDCTIPTGSEGVTTVYGIGWHIYVDGSSNELVEAYVASSWPSSTGTLREGYTDTYIKLYEVTQTGFTIASVNPVFTVIAGYGTHASALAAVSAAVNALSYQPGDSVSGYAGAGGYVTASGKEVLFNIPMLRKPIGPAVTSVTVSNFSARMRQNGKYIFGSASARASVASDHITVMFNGFGILLSVRSDAAYTGAVNNGSVGVDFSATLTFG
jgi:hypothetical protein